MQDANSTPLRIVTLGTSLTNQKEWQRDLAALLTARLGQPVTVAKVARGGMTSRWGLQQVEAVVALRPDIVLAEFLINDADVRHRLWPRESEANHRALLGRLRAALPEVRILLMTMSPAHGLIRRRILRPFAERYDRLYRDLQARGEVELIDIAPHWRGADLTRDIPDGVHPTRDAMLRVTVPAIAGALARAGPGR